MGRARGATGALAVAIGLTTVLAACSSAGPSAAPGGASLPTAPSSPATVGAPSTAAPTTVPSVSAPVLTTPVSPPASSPATSSGPSGPTGPSGPSSPATHSTSISQGPPPGPPTCSLTQLTVRGLAGGATTGTENALLLFTNSSRTVCTLDGFPRITLRGHKGPVGTPSQPGTGSAQSVVLGPGKMAQATLSASTTCQAPESEQARIRLPHQAGYVDVVLSVRACTLTAGAIVPAS
jgi:hypothetical protein